MKADKLLKGLQKALQSPFVLAIVPALLLLYFLPLGFEKYTAEIVLTNRMGQTQPIAMREYHDLNQDGIPERIQLGSRYDIDSSLSYILVMTQNNLFRDEWIMRSEIVQNAPISFCDVNQDGTQEVFFFTQKRDSIFINQLDPFGHPELGVQSIFVELISPDRETYDITVHDLGFADNNGDQEPEFTFVIAAGYCRQPRRLYRFHTDSRQIECSAATGIGILPNSSHMVVDVDGDGKNEYLISTTDFKNYSEILDQTSLKHVDTCAWVLAYDDDLSLLFEPVPTWKVNFVPGLIRAGGKVYFYYVDKMPDGYHQEIIIRDFSGKVHKRFDVLPSYSSLTAMPLISRENQHEILIANYQSIYTYDTTGAFLNDLNISDIITADIFKLDLFSNGNLYYIMNANFGLYIMQKDFSDRVFIPLPETLITPLRFSVVSYTPNSAMISANGSNYDYEISFARNPAYLWRYPVWTGIYLAVVLLLWLTQWLQKRQLRQKFEAERELMSFRFRALKNQVDPHFTLNALNSIAYMQEHGQQEKAGRFLVKFSRMIHRTLESSDKIETTLEDELAFVRDYLDVQQMRFREAFAYNISIDDEELYDLAVPRHLVHTFVENALKHGIRPLDKGGIISIVVQRKDQHMHINISDNGVGRAEAAKYKKHSTGKGLQIIDELIELFEKLKKVKISYQIKDLHSDSGKAEGTLVEISFPVEEDNG